MAHDHGTNDMTVETQDIVLGNGEANKIQLGNMNRSGPSLTVASVTAAQDSFLVLHPFANGAPVQTDYVGSAFVPEGTSERVHLRLDENPAAGQPFIIMLHSDANTDGQFQFGDGVTVPDAPVFEGNTLIALPMQAPEDGPVTPEIIRASAAENAQKYAAFAERSSFREDAFHAEARALAHAWLATVESHDRTVGKAMGFLADGFVLDFPSDPISDATALESWLNGPAASFAATRHVLHDIQTDEADDGRHTMSMEMEWDGLLADGSRMSARTKHDWTLRAVEGDLKIASMDVQILEPFRPTEWD